MKKTVLILALALTTSLTFAQDAAVPPATVITGSADMYGKYDFSGGVGNANFPTSFTNSHNSFELGMASLQAAHKSGKTSVFVDLGFGKRASEFTYNDAANTFMIKQLTFTYDVTDKFKVIAGSFATHLGYELVDAIANRNYSMSYAFTYGPFFNTGVKAQYTSGKFSFMAGVTNPTDFKTAMEGGSTQKTFIGQVGYVGSSESAYLNVTSGSSNPNLGVVGGGSDSNATQIDLVGTKKLNDKISLGFNGTYKMIANDFDANLDTNFMSLIGYGTYTVKDNLNVSYRLEYFKMDETSKGANDDFSIYGNTLSLNYKVGNLTIIPEIRSDFSSLEIFTKDSTPTKSNSYFLLATTYSF